MTVTKKATDIKNRYPPTLGNGFFDALMQNNNLC